jgi:hypothetical protein
MRLSMREYASVRVYEPLLDRVFSPGMEGMAFHETDHCQTEPMQWAVASHRVQGILGTGRFEPACRTEQGGNQETVPSNDPQEQLPHVKLPLGESGELAAMTTPTSASTRRTAV